MIGHEDLQAAELVAEFEGLRTGLGDLVPFTVHWHAGRRQWLYDALYERDITTAEALRTFAEGILAAVRTRGGDWDVELSNDGYARVEAGAGFDTADGPVELTLFAWYDSQQDFAGVGPRGQALYQNHTGWSLLPLSGPVPDEERLATSARALLERLETTPPETPPPAPAVPQTIVSFRARQTLLVQRLGDDGAWQITITGLLTAPVHHESVRVLANVLLNPGAGPCPMVHTDRYRLDLALDGDHLLARAASPAENGGEHTLDIWIGPLTEQQISDAARTLLNEVPAGGGDHDVQ
ncbi:hypothetical protein [Actinomadura rudentiformis]|uniref:Uncharacterized protein n=1 Tax=Actinomadura rudentiformis TaxID=359158 RepID=A0A6H9YZZ9_9ACTN|nr:hypothetical protein [Actinomadura rudentiformis]KAB2352450.1 hypothetical protein F8566_01840 [Actinomadura rudentiformis]